MIGFILGDQNFLLHVLVFILMNMYGIYNVKLYSLLSQCLESHVGPACQFQASCILGGGRFGHIISTASGSWLLFGMTVPSQLQAPACHGRGRIPWPSVEENHSQSLDQTRHRQRI